MTRRLQSFDFRKSPYDRPNQKWVCGRPEAPCKSGPDGRGRCRAQAHCAPRQDGARWVCTRTRDLGSPCSEGPRPDGRCAHPIPPCHPVRSLRARRGVVTRWATALALGLVVLALAGQGRERAISPGPLTTEHAEVAECAGCHEAGNAGPAGLTRATLAGVPAAHEGDSQACLDCHEMGEHPFRPHGTTGLPTPKPRETGQAGAGGPRPQLSPPYGLNLASRTFPEPDETPGGTACATCHKEHEGAMADLTAMGDARCQACHSEKFAAFAHGHPPFGDYPYTRRTRINFDHVAHAGKHFDEADAPGPERCTACHAVDQAGAVMRTKRFETGCAACHAGEVRGQKIAGSPGLPVLAVPWLDTVTLAARDVAIGAWPELADADLTPFMTAILAGRAGIDRQTLQRFKDLDTLDLRGATSAELETVKAVAWAVKRLVYDLTADGPQTLAQALQASLGSELEPAAVRDMLGALPQDAVRAAQREWFPNLAQEIARRDAGQRVPMPGAEAAGEADAEDVPAEPAAEEAASAADGDLLGGGDGSGAGEDGDLLGGQGAGPSEDGGDLLGGGSQPETTPEGGDLLGDSQEAAPEDGGDLLGNGDPAPEDAGGDLLGGQDKAEDGGGLLGAGDGESGDGGGLMSGGGGDGAGDSGGTADAAAWKDATMPEPVPAQWSRMGGWYRDFFVLYYRPADHADGFLRRWLDATAPRAEGDGPAAAIFARLADPKAPGRCTKCHSVDRRAAGKGVRVNWQARTTGVSGTRLTQFAHGPHLTLTSARKGCATCHAFDREADYPASFDDRDPGTFASNFQPVDKATCTQCHTADQAGDACTQCHAYHAEDPASTAVQTEMGSAGMRR